MSLLPGPENTSSTTASGHSRARLRSRRRAPAALAASGFALVGLLLGGAYSPAVALTSEEIRCRDMMAETARMAASIVMKARSECARGRMGGTIDPAADCMADPPDLGGTGTGDDTTDRRLTRLGNTAASRGARMTRMCASVDPAKNLLPADVLDPASSCAAAADWEEASQCAVDLGKQAADTVHLLLDVQPAFAPLSDGDVECFGHASAQVRKTMFRLNLWRAKCFRTDDTLVDGGGLYDCAANINPPGSYQTTGWLRADKRLEFPMETLEIVLHGECDKDLYLIGFDAVTPDHSGGDWDTRITVDDIFDSLDDAVATQVTMVMAEMFPVGNYCGDGAVGGSEACDDGNNTSNDGCDRDCSLPDCPNGAIDGASSAEECDDGNTADGDGCSATCEVELCGNGVRNLGWQEECDDAGESPSCDDDCTYQSCGDGKLNTSAGEQCDNAGANDSNTPDACGDGSGPSLRGACQLPFCPDGVIDSGETCDDGGETVACDLNCTPASCGDGDLNSTRGETCDDGNATDSDSCPSSNSAGNPYCLTATCGDGFVCSDPFTCTTGPGGGIEDCDSAGVSASCDGDCSLAVCGDGTLNLLNVTPPARATGEACDDGNLVNGDGCDGNCTFTACGNGVVTAPETCDDGNHTNADGCDDGATGNCTPTTCGNGIVTAGESCDGNGVGTGGETATCDTDCSARACGDATLNVTAGEDCDDGVATATCDTDCSFAVCGDGRVNAAAGETCDGNGAGTGGETAACDANCTAASCGDGTVNLHAGEQCDDGNNFGGDGCSATCTVE